LGLFAEKGIGT